MWLNILKSTYQFNTRYKFCYNIQLITSLTVKITTSSMASSHSVMGDVYKVWEQIHRHMVDW